MGFGGCDSHKDRLDGTSILSTLSLARFQLRRVVDQALWSYAGGVVLEMGAVRLRHARVLSNLSYADITFGHRAGQDVEVLRDIQSIGSNASTSFDGVPSTQVLEHVPNPSSAVAGLAAVKPGKMLTSTPLHLSMIHEAS